jgi:hypothetical protein
MSRSESPPAGQSAPNYPASPRGGEFPVGSRRVDTRLQRFFMQMFLHVRIEARLKVAGQQPGSRVRATHSAPSGDDAGFPGTSIDCWRAASVPLVRVVSGAAGSPQACPQADAGPPPPALSRSTARSPRKGNRQGIYLQAGCPHPHRVPCIFPFAQSSEQ